VSGLKINRRLNLVVPIEDDDGVALYVHSVPISREVFDRYCRVIARTFTLCYAIAANAGMRIASNVLRETAEDMGIWEDVRNPGTGEVIRAGVKNGLLAEIHRLTNVKVLGADGRGWDAIPYELAIRQGKLDEDTAAEVESLIVFFTVASWMHQKRELPTIYLTVFGLWNAQTTSLNCTEWTPSLPTSTATDSSGETATPSSIPS
jgi:hypothetical protein